MATKRVLVRKSRLGTRNEFGPDWQTAIQEALGWDEREKLIAQTWEQIEAERVATRSSSQRLENEAKKRKRAQRTVQAWLDYKEKERTSATKTENFNSCLSRGHTKTVQEHTEGGEH